MFILRFLTIDVGSAGNSAQARTHAQHGAIVSPFFSPFRKGKGAKRKCILVVE
jgi:hypothetical protein